MTFVAGDPVSSGRPYPVVKVGDRTPTSLADFVGHLAVVIDCGGRQQIITGIGDRRGEVVRFYEKDTATEKDVRAWQIGFAAGSGSTAARHGSCRPLVEIGRSAFTFDDSPPADGLIRWPLEPDRWASCSTFCPGIGPAHHRASALGVAGLVAARAPPGRPGSV